MKSEHLADLEASGITQDTAVEAGLHSIESAKMAEMLGFPVPAETSGLVFRYERDFFRVKLFPPMAGSNGTMRYAQPKDSGVRLYIPHNVRSILKNPNMPLYVAEGEKKALKASQEGLPCIGVGGLWSWRKDGEPIEDLNQITLVERKVIVVPDSDVWPRPDLLKAIYAFGAELVNRGATVSLVIIPQEGEEKVGLDDFLVKNGRSAFDSLKTIDLKHKCFTGAKEWHKKWTKDHREDKPAKVDHLAAFPGLVEVVADDKGAPAFFIKKGNYFEVRKTIEVDGKEYYPPPPESMKWLLPRGSEVLRYLNEDTNRALYDDLVTYHKGISQLPSEDHYHLLATWDFHTYLYEKCEYSPYIWLYAIPERGKTRTGKGCIYVARRALHVESLRDPYIIRVAQNLGATLFFDVTDLWKKAQKGQTEDILLLRYEKGATVPRVLYPDRGPHRDTVYFDIYGPTIVATNKMVSEILATRSIQIVMPESDREFDDDVKPEDGLPLKERLVAFRARHMDDPLPEAPKPTSRRLGDITRPLMQILKLVAPEEEQRFLALCRRIKSEHRENLADTLEGRILQAMVDLENEIFGGLLAAAEITQKINEGSPEKWKKTQSYITRTCKSMGFKSTRPQGETHIEIAPDLFEKLRKKYIEYTPEKSAQTALSAQDEQSQGDTECTFSAENIEPEKVHPKVHRVSSEDDNESAESAESAEKSEGRKRVNYPSNPNSEACRDCSYFEVRQGGIYCEKTNEILKDMETCPKSR